ncbi:MAG: hypothetical protein WCJ39_08390 [bacterium]
MNKKIKEIALERIILLEMPLGLLRVMRGRDEEGTVYAFIFPGGKTEKILPEQINYKELKTILQPITKKEFSEFMHIFSERFNFNPKKK